MANVNANSGLNEIPHYEHKRPLPMIPHGTTFLYVSALQMKQVTFTRLHPRLCTSAQARNLEQWDDHDKMMHAFLCEALAARQQTSRLSPTAIVVQLRRPRVIAKDWDSTVSM